MPMNAQYRGPIDLPEVIPVFPLPGALLLPRGQMPLNIFEPRYLAMIDDALRDGHRLIGMIQPDVAHAGNADNAAALQDRLRRPHHPARRKRRRPLPDRAHRRRALPHRGRAARSQTLYRQCRVTYAPFADDFVARKGEDEVDREAVLAALRDFLEANDLNADWEGIDKAPNEALVNALSMMSPYGAAEKQALLGGARPQDPRRDPGRHHRDRARQEEHRGRAAVAVTLSARSAGRTHAAVL